ncbi:ornithine decarboxylase-like [Clavelina lepadiformis]|uniref:ornithine decarboxylase-like n=1 Tax=Clavelina lepadiformis TaxID=159417 RepID=UPI0040433BC2
MKQVLASGAITSVELFPYVDTHSIIKNKTLENSSNENCDDAFFICDLGDVVNKHNRWLHEFPRIHPHYAIKCNPDPTMLKMLLAFGTGFDCASKTEIQQMLDLGATPDQIIFANPCKQASHIRYARDNKVKLIVFDNENELVKMKKIYPNADLVLRIQTDDSNSVCRFSMKYGAHPDSCPQLIDTAFKMGLNVVGISFHVGSGCQDVNAYMKALQNAQTLFDYAAKLGHQFTLLDIGGGFPGTEDVDLTFEKIAAVVNHQLDVLFPQEENQHVRVIAEPGRYYAASAFTLATNVIAKRDVARDLPTDENLADGDAVLNAVIPQKCDEPAYMYYVNDGLYGSFNCLFYDHAKVTPTLLKKFHYDTLKFSSSIWGPTCDGLDQITKHILLPEIDTGDWIIWHDMGAYTVAAGSAFNGFKTKKMFYVISDENCLLMKKIILQDRVMSNVRFVSCSDMQKPNRDNYYMPEMYDDNIDVERIASDPAADKCAIGARTEVIVSV